MTEFHDEYTELLGAYALDAVDPDERARIEAHLQTCPWCAAEVAQHREVAAYLSHSGTDAPEGVWDRIAAELSPPAPPMRLSLTPSAPAELLPRPAGPSVDPGTTDDVVAPIASARSARASRSIGVRTFVAVISAAAVLLALVGFVAVNQYQKADDMEREVAGGTIPPSASDLKVTLTGEGSRMGATAVVDESGKGYLVSHDLPAPGAEELYQLWGQVDGVVLSLGTFDDRTDVVNFQVHPDRLDDIEAFAVTKERNPGVLASENPPVLVGEVA